MWTKLFLGRRKVERWLIAGILLLMATMLWADYYSRAWRETVSSSYAAEVLSLARRVRRSHDQTGTWPRTLADIDLTGLSDDVRRRLTYLPPADMRPGMLLLPDVPEPLAGWDLVHDKVWFVAYLDGGYEFEDAERMEVLLKRSPGVR